MKHWFLCLLNRVEEKEVDKFCQQLVPLIRVTALSPTAQQSGSTGRTLKFLFLHTFFKVFKSTKDIPHVCFLLVKVYLFLYIHFFCCVFLIYFFFFFCVAGYISGFHQFGWDFCIFEHFLVQPFDLHG